MPAGPPTRGFPDSRLRQGLGLTLVLFVASISVGLAGAGGPTFASGSGGAAAIGSPTLPAGHTDLAGLQPIAVSPRPAAQPGSHLIAGPKSCAGNGGVWWVVDPSQNWCLFDSFNFGAGTTWQIFTDALFRGAIDDYGSVQLFNDSQVLGKFNVNHGAFLSNAGELAVINASGGLEVHGSVQNAYEGSQGPPGAIYLENGGTLIVYSDGELDNLQCAPCGFGQGALISVGDNSSTLWNMGLLQNSGTISVACGGVWKNDGRFIQAGGMSDRSGPGCLAGSRPQTPPFGRVSGPFATAGATNTGTITVEADSAIDLGYNATFTNSGTIELLQGYPGSPYSSPVPPGAISLGYHAHALANSGTIYDSGNITGNVSGTGRIEVLCHGTVYGSTSAGTRVSACDSTRTVVSVAPTTDVASGYVGYRITVRDTTASGGSPPIGSVTWSDGSQTARFPYGAVCTLRPASPNTSSCGVVYFAGPSNGSVSITANFTATDPGTDQFQPSSGTANLTIGASKIAAIGSSTGCTALGGSWNSTGSRCSVATLSIGSNESLTVTGGVTLSIGSALNSSGYIVNLGNVSVGGTVNNSGTVTNVGTWTDLAGSSVSNRGVFYVQGPVRNAGSFDNQFALIDVPGTCQGCAWGNFTNSGRLVGEGTSLNDFIDRTFSSNIVLNNLAGGMVLANGSWTAGGWIANRGSLTLGRNGSLYDGYGVNNSGNLTNRGSITSTVGGDLLINARGGLVSNFGNLSRVGVTNSVGATLDNGAGGNWSVNATLNDYGTFVNGPGGSLGIGLLASLNVLSGGRLNNSANASVLDLGYLTNAGTVTNSAGGLLTDAWFFVNAAGGLVVNSGEFANFLYQTTEPGSEPRLGSLTNDGNVTGSGSVNDSLGVIQSGCGDSVGSPVIGAPVESICGRTTRTTIASATTGEVVGQPWTVSVVVRDPHPNSTAPLGNVTVSSGTGLSPLVGPACALAKANASSSSCNVTLSSSSQFGGILTATYLGDAHHSTSGTAKDVLVGGRHTLVTLRLPPGRAKVGGSVTLRANVSDTSPGTPSTPTGLVGWTDDGSGGGFATGGVCSLRPVGGSTASCAIAYTAPYLNGNVTIVATYLGDAAHEGGPGSAALAVGKPCSCRTVSTPDPIFGGNFGEAVAVGGDTLVVGAPYENSSTVAHAGVAYVLNATTGVRIDTLSDPHGAAYAEFGYSVALGGPWVVVGEPSGGSGSAGVALVFNATTGHLVATLQSPHPANGYGQFGLSVALDGGRVLVGAPGENAPVNGSNVSSAGRAYLFSARTGTLLRSLMSPNPTDVGEFGFAVALNGSRGLVGQPDLSTGSGRAYLYNVTGWKLVAKLASSDPRTLGKFGYSVGLDGSWAIVGAPYENAAPTSTVGRVHVFAAGNGSPVADLVSRHRVYYGEFGNSVAVVGNAVVIGAPGEYGYRNASRGGNTYEFAANGTFFRTWTGPATYSGFGWSVGASGVLVAVGAPYLVVDGAASAGQAYLF